MFQFAEKNHTIFDGRGWFAVAVFNPKTYQNIGVLFRTCAIHGAAFLSTIGHRYKAQMGDTTKCHIHLPIFNFESFELLKNTLPANCEIVAVEMTPKAKMLNEFQHPERALYLLGSEDFGIPEHILKECHRQVKMPGNISMNLAVAGSGVVLDRIMYPVK